MTFLDTVPLGSPLASAEQKKDRLGESDNLRAFKSFILYPIHIAYLKILWSCLLIHSFSIDLLHTCYIVYIYYIKHRKNKIS